jgi:hypothetical protein
MDVRSPILPSVLCAVATRNKCKSTVESLPPLKLNDNSCGLQSRYEHTPRPTPKHTNSSRC